MQERMKRVLLLSGALLLATAGGIRGGQEGANQDAPKGGEMVLVEDFGSHIDKYEVTNAEYAEFLDDRGNQKEGGMLWIELDSQYALIEATAERFIAKEGFERHPVVEVSWYGARAYCAWAGKRLPTQTEWRQACEGKQGFRFPWGDIFAPGKANIYGTKDGYLRTAPVGSFPEGASPCGAMDMAGNVWEWMDVEEGQPPYLRGGSWINGKTLARCANRASTADSHSYIKGNSLGFRCAR